MKERGVKGRFKVVYSSEKTERKLMELEDFQKENPDNFRALPNMRLRIIPVLGTMPALFGQVVAAHSLSYLAGKPLLAVKTDDVRYQNYHKMEVRLTGKLKKKKLQEMIDYDIRDIYFCAREVFNWTCALTRKKVSNVSIWVWDFDKKVDCSNMILVSNHIYSQLEKTKVGDYEAFKIQIFGEERIKEIDELLAQNRVKINQGDKDLYTWSF